MAVGEQCPNKELHEKHYWSSQESALSAGYGFYPRRWECDGVRPTARIVTVVAYDVADAPPAGQRAELVAALGNGLMRQVRASGLPEPTAVMTYDETEPMMRVPVRLMRDVFDEASSLDQFWAGMNEAEKLWKDSSEAKS